VVPFGIENTNWGWTSVVTSGTLYSMGTAINPGVGRRVYVFTGTSNQYIAMPGAFSFVSVVPEYYFINNSTGNLYIEDTVGFSIATVPPGGDATVTGTAGSIAGYTNWHASVGNQYLGLGWTQTWQVVSRSLAVTYTNSTGRPIQVSIYFLGSTQSNFIVNGLTIASNSSQTGWMTVSEVIPPNATYQLVDINGGLGSLNWYELR
jgi:hypothetical protein